VNALEVLRLEGPPHAFLEDSPSKITQAVVSTVTVGPSMDLWLLRGTATKWL